MIGRFRSFIDEAELQELLLRGRMYTWLSEHDNPTLERIDRVLTSEHWMHSFPDHDLSPLSMNCFDHAPPLLKTDCTIPI